MDGLMAHVFAPLSLPLSGHALHSIEPAAMWHARCMVAAWGVLLPLGALVARFFKVLPGQDWPRVLDHKAWWHAHRALQYAGVVLMAVGLWLLWGRTGSSNTNTNASALAHWHAWAGWAVSGLGGVQVLGALARGSKGGPTDTQLRGDHYDMTPWRVAFERLHKGLGWLAVVAALGVIVLGLLLSDAPRWMALALALWWLVLATAFVQLQRAGRCVDTYQAIWGPSPHHPGNQRQPTGLGVRRPLG
jgi:Eukaryotic cytochrome b561